MQLALLQKNVINANQKNTKNMATTIINIFGGPGIGKSTIAASLFSTMKMNGYDAELVTEYAKEKTWELDTLALKCQPYITSEQLFRQYRLLDKVQYVITDSPLITGIIYAGSFTNDDWKSWCLWSFNQFNNINFNLIRNKKHKFSESGRNQTELESQEIDNKIKKYLIENKIAHTDVVSDDKTINKIVSMLK